MIWPVFPFLVLLPPPPSPATFIEDNTKRSVLNHEMEQTKPFSQIINDDTAYGTTVLTLLNFMDRHP